MLERDVFKSFLSVIERIQHSIAEETMLLEKLYEDFDGINKRLVEAEESLVDALCSAMSSDMVAWWVYDCYCGDVPLSVIQDGIEVVVTDADTLYDMILKESNGAGS